MITIPPADYRGGNRKFDNILRIEAKTNSEFRAKPMQITG